MNKKLNVGILFGGKSAEHEISIRSATNIIEAIDKDKYEVLLLGIDKNGKWLAGQSAENLLLENTSSDMENREGDLLAFVPGKRGSNLVDLQNSGSMPGLDVVFPVLHGPMGEDGTVQGMLKLADIPFVGSGVLGSAAGMDKDVMKRLFRDSDIPVGGFEIVYSHDLDRINYEKIADNLGLPLFIKPANLGSSVGVHRVNSREEFDSALEDAFRFDNKLIIEEYINGREIECAVLGNEFPIASVPGEIVTQHDFYSYKAKYLDEKGAELKIPAELHEDITEKIRNLSIRSFQAVCCSGMARVDCFLRDDEEIYINEVNTIPGFTSISMYPMLWEASGIPYSELIDRLIQLAIERHEKEKKLKTDYQ
ncbi:D-alanine--D-alanine ligase [Thermodesulfobacteriota bacterium]